MKKLLILLIVLASAFAASSQAITDTGHLRSYINSNILSNNSRSITALQLNNIFNGLLNTYPSDSLSISTGTDNDTLFVWHKGIKAYFKLLRVGTSLGVTAYLSLTDVALTSLSDAQLVKWNASTSKWNNFTLDKSFIGLSAVENRALSTWGGSLNLDSLGTVTKGIWNGSQISDTYISSAANWNAKQPAIITGLSTQYINGLLGLGTFSPATVGLGNVQNVDQTNASNLTTGSVPSGRYGNTTIPISAINATSLGAVDSLLFLRKDGKWGIVPIGVSSYSALTDVVLTSIANGQLVKWNSSTSKWNNFTPAPADVEGWLGFTPMNPTGTSLQYWKGNGALATFPTDLSSFTNGPAYLAGTVGVPNGGLGLSTLTANQLLAAGATSTANAVQIALGTAGWVLTSNGPSSPPSMQAPPTSSTLNLLTDVALTSLSNAQIIKWNSSTSKWNNFTPGPTDVEGWLGFTPMNPTGTSSQYWKGNGTLGTFPANVSSFINDAAYYKPSDTLTTLLTISQWQRTKDTLSIIHDGAPGNIWNSYAKAGAFHDKPDSSSAEIAVFTAADSTKFYALVSSSIANGKLATMVNNRVKGNVSGSTANPSDLTGAQVTAILSQATTSTQGVVPPPGTASGKVLQDDLTWHTPGTGTISFDNIAAINSTAAVTGVTISLRGYTAVGDGGGGDFFYVSGSSATAVPGMIISVTGGRLFRLWDGHHLNILWFGAVGDGTTDNTAAFQAACNFQSYVDLYIPSPAVSYIIKNNVYLNLSGVHLRGQDKYGTKIIEPIGNTYTGGAAIRSMFVVGNIKTNGGVSNTMFENLNLLNQDTVTRIGGNSIQPSVILAFQDTAGTHITGMSDSGGVVRNCVISNPAGQGAGLVLLAFRSGVGGSIKGWKAYNNDFTNIAGCASEILNTNTFGDNRMTDNDFYDNNYNNCGNVFPANGFGLSIGGSGLRNHAKHNRLHHIAGIGIEMGGSSYSSIEDNSIDSSDLSQASGKFCVPWVLNNANGNGGGTGVGNIVARNVVLDSTYFAPYYLNQDKVTITGNKWQSINSINSGSDIYIIGSVSNAQISDEYAKMTGAQNASFMMAITNFSSLGPSHDITFSNCHYTGDSGCLALIHMQLNAAGIKFSNCTFNKFTTLVNNDGTAEAPVMTDCRNKETGLPYNSGGLTSTGPAAILTQEIDSTKKQIPFDGNASHFLNGQGHLATPSGSAFSGTVGQDVLTDPSTGLLVTTPRILQTQVLLASVAPLPANSYSAGVITATNNADTLWMDGFKVPLNGRVLVRNEANPVNNGIYTLTQLATASLPFILTRESLSTISANMQAMSQVSIQYGRQNGGTTFYQQTPNVVIGTSPLVFATNKSYLDKGYPPTTGFIALGTSIFYGLCSGCVGGIEKSAPDYFAAAFNVPSYHNYALSSTSVRYACYAMGLNTGTLQQSAIISDANFNMSRLNTTTGDTVHTFGMIRAGNRRIASFQFTNSIQFYIQGNASAVNTNVTSSGSATGGLAIDTLKDFSSRAVYYRLNDVANSTMNVRWIPSTSANQTDTIRNVPGSAIGIGVMADTIGFSPIQVTVDGVAIGTYTGDGVCNGINWEPGWTFHREGIMPDEYVITGLRDTLHTVILKYTVGSKIGYWDHIASFKTPSASLPNPYYLLDNLYMASNGYAVNGATAAMLDSSSNMVFNDLQNNYPGWPIFRGNANYPSGNYRASTMTQSDGIHYNSLGANFVAQALVGAVNTKLFPVAATSTPVTPVVPGGSSGSFQYQGSTGTFNGSPTGSWKYDSVGNAIVGDAGYLVLQSPSSSNAFLGYNAEILGGLYKTLNTDIATSLQFLHSGGLALANSPSLSSGSTITWQYPFYMNGSNQIQLGGNVNFTPGNTWLNIAASTAANSAWSVNNSTVSPTSPPEGGVWNLNHDYVAFLNGVQVPFTHQVTAGTVGQPLFYLMGGQTAGGDSHYFWDNTNKRLGIGNAMTATTTLPEELLVQVNHAGIAEFRIQNDATSTTDGEMFQAVTNGGSKVFQFRSHNSTYTGSGFFQPNGGAIYGNGDHGIAIDEDGGSGANANIYFGTQNTERARFNALGNFLVQTTADSSSYIHVGAGSATKAPLKLTAGTVLTTPINGAIEFDGTNFYGTAGGARISFGGTPPNLQSVFTVGATLTTNNTITNTGHTLTHTGGTDDYTGATITMANQTQGDNSTKGANTAYADAHLPAVVAHQNLAGQTGSNASVIVYNTPAVDATFLFAPNAAVTTATSAVLVINVTYTDETNNVRTYTFFPQGTSSGNITTTGAYQFAPISIRTKASTTVTLSTSFSGTTIAYDIGGVITQLN